MAALLALLPTKAAGQALPGCYDVEVTGPWRVVAPGRGEAPDTLVPPGLDEMVYLPPPRVRLHDEPAERWRSGRRVSIPDGSLPSPHPFRTWRTEGDTLRVVFSTGFVGTDLELRRADGGGWAGAATTFTDVAGQRRYGQDVTLTPVDCDAPPDFPASLDPPLPRSVVLTDGGVLELGRPVPDGIELLPRPSGAWTAMVSAAGPWAGNDTVVLRIDPDDVVHHIELRYPDDRDLADLVEAVAPGHPYVHDGEGSRSWWNRTTRVFVQFDPRPRVVLSDRRY